MAKTHRMTIELTEESNDHLVALKVNSGANSKVQVIRTALALYEILLRESVGDGTVAFRDKNGEMDNLYKLYCPSAPVPWSGLPIVFAKPEQVIMLKISFGEVYAITTSFGRSAPEILEELTFEAEAEQETS